MRDRKKVATGEAITTLLNDCTLEVLDRSVYGNAPNFDWADALVGDRTLALLGLREATNGATYEFSTRCTDADCKRMIAWTINLNDLPKKPLPEESKELYLSGNSFMTQVDGRVVKFRLMTGRDQMKLAKAISHIKRSSNSKEGRQEKMLLGLASRINEVEGAEDVLAWLEDLDLADITQLMRAMEKVDCGVETGITIECDACDLEQEIDLPLDRQFFVQDI